ncbi:hypothetical protein [Maritimibacter sp. DP1N21-5]|uniref:hypothetical protein n=1 Tax=Maritimibacter sp. DP1N21-5 TaxID=2836867 RepID=UPI001C4682B7|nr:hypothetical protein [Maritimibacter sp. DP1N21-5]MBV7409155.1 hypothetical protein [Maritimibacter sp. DP1N21-5]
MTNHFANGAAETHEPGFRMMLRRASRQAHDRTEAIFADFLADPAAHVSAYLCAQRVGIAALVMARAEGFGPSHQGLYGQMIADLDADCARRGLNPPVLMHDLRLHPVAVDYILLGARLGTEVIRRRVAAAGVDPMPRHFRQMGSTEAWRMVCARLDRIAPTSPLAEAVTADVANGFDLFARAAHMTLSDAARPPGTRPDPEWSAAH